MEPRQTQSPARASPKTLLCTNSVWVSVWSYDASLCRLPQQSSKGDDRWHAGTVEEEERGHTLEAETVLEVTQIERSLSFDVQYEATKQPKRLGLIIFLLLKQ